MKNTTSIIISLVGGALLGSAVTCIVRDHCKMKKGDIHKKIIAELEQLQKFVAEHHPEMAGTCEGSSCNVAKE